MTFSEVKQTVDPTRIGAEIGILVYPNSQAAAVYGLTDLFCAANAIHCARGGAPCSEISVSHWKLNEDSRRIRRIYSTHPDRTQKLAVVILPPSMEVPSGSNPKRERLCRWLKARLWRGSIWAFDGLRS